jgi:hypothetical protein
MHKNNVKSKLKVLDDLLSDTFINGGYLSEIYNTTYSNATDIITIKTKYEIVSLSSTIVKIAMSFCQLYQLDFFIHANSIHLYFNNED